MGKTKIGLAAGSEETQDDVRPGKLRNAFRLGLLLLLGMAAGCMNEAFVVPNEDSDIVFSGTTSTATLESDWYDVLNVNAVNIYTVLPGGHQQLIATTSHFAPLTLGLATTHFWTVSGRIPPTAWVPGLQGSTAEIAAYAALPGAEYPLAICPNTSIRASLKTCPLENPPPRVPEGALLTRAGVVCTKNFLPEGRNRRSYCDRPTVWIGSGSSLDPYVFESPTIHETPTVSQSVEWYGDPATALADHRSNLQSGCRDTVFVGYAGGRESNARQVYRAAPANDSAIGITPRIAVTPRASRFDLLNLGECSTSLGWGDIRAALLKPDAAGQTPIDLIEQTVKGLDSHIKSAQIRRLILKPEADRAQLRGMSYRPQPVITGLFVEVTVFIDLPAGSWVIAHFTGMANLETRPFPTDEAAVEPRAIGPSPGTDRRIFLTLTEPFVFHSISSSGVFGNSNTDTVRHDIQKGLAFDVTDYLGPTIKSALAAGVSVRRIVTTYDALNAVLAESGADPTYRLLDALGYCKDALVRVGEPRQSYRDIVVRAEAGFVPVTPLSCGDPTTPTTTIPTTTTTSLPATTLPPSCFVQALDGFDRVSCRLETIATQLAHASDEELGGRHQRSQLRKRIAKALALVAKGRRLVGEGTSVKALHKAGKQLNRFTRTVERALQKNVVPAEIARFLLQLSSSASAEIVDLRLSAR